MRYYYPPYIDSGSMQEQHLYLAIEGVGIDIGVYVNGNVGSSRNDSKCVRPKKKTLINKNKKYFCMKYSYVLLLEILRTVLIGIAGIGVRILA